MKTTSKANIEKAARLHNLIQRRLEIEKEERELKDFFKDEIKDGILEAGPIIILIECKVRMNLDNAALTKELGERIHDFEKQTEYKQVTVRTKGA